MDEARELMDTEIQGEVLQAILIALQREMHNPDPTSELVLAAALQPAAVGG